MSLNCSSRCTVFNSILFSVVFLCLTVAVLPALPAHAACTPPPAGQTSWWPAEGQAVDIVGPNHGTLKNGPAFGPGQVGQAFKLDGVDDYIDIGPLAELQNATGITVMAWVNRTDTANNLAGYIGKWDAAGSPSNTFLLYNGEGSYANKGAAVFQFDDDSTTGVQGTTTIPNGQWTLVAATWNSGGGQTALYKNGNLEGSSTGGAGRTLKYHTVYPARIGEWGTLHPYPYKFKGSIDEPMVFNRALSQAEIRSIFLAGSAGLCGGIVTNLNDSGAGSLRAATNYANSHPGPDVISFAPGVAGIIRLTTGQLPVENSTTINGPGARILTVSGNNASRVFFFSRGSSSISGLMISNGLALPSTTDGFAVGGGILNSTELLITNCMIYSNRAYQPRFEAKGGGIDNAGDLTMRNCTVAYNVAEGHHANGAGLHNDYSSTARLINCTFSNNTVKPLYFGHAGAGAGAGILTRQFAAATATNCTIWGNNWYSSDSNATATGGGLYNIGTFELQNSIVAGNQGHPSDHDVWGVYTSRGNNVIRESGGSSGWIASDKLDAASLPLSLTGLLDNGGPTYTHALLSGVAVDAGNDAVLGSPDTLTTDQRGYPRKMGPHVDIGAVELDPSQSGSTLVVNTLADHDDGVCGVTDCTLADAIRRANANPDANTITTITFKPGLTGTIINSVSVGLLLQKSINIVGPGARVLAVSGNNSSRVFQMGSGITVRISGLTIRNGGSLGKDEENIVPSDRGVAGGIYTNANLTLTNCTLSGNQAVGGDGFYGSGAIGLGGAIFNDTSGILTVIGCTLSSNAARGGDGGLASGDGGDGHGGGIYNLGRLTLTNCTLSGNAATGNNGATNFNGSPGDGGAGLGGGIYSSTPENVIITHCTISGNIARGGIGGTGENFTRGANGHARGGGVMCNNGNFTVRNSIAAVNTASEGPDAYGAFSSSGFNLIGTAADSSGWNAADILGTNAARIDPELAALANNGGPTDTRLLTSGSPAIDKGSRFGVAVDQRSQYRPYDNGSIANATNGDGSDIGAVEVGPASPSMRLSESAYFVTEIAGSASITVVRYGSVDNAATVNYSTANSSALAGSDYTATAGTLTFAAGESSKSFSVSIINNTVCESIESLAVALSSPSAGYTLISPTSAPLNIYDDDCNFTISGRVANHSGTGLANVQVTRSGGASVLTNSSGNFTFTGVKQGIYTITPIVSASLSGAIFTPSSTGVTVNNANIAGLNFTASFTISGRVANSSGVGVPNVAVSRTTSSSGVSTTTDATGKYVFSGVRNGGYTITPAVTSMPGISFFPTSTSVTVNTSNVSNINFTAFFSISGRITNSAGAGMANVLVTRSSGGSSTSVLTNGSGNYIFAGVRAGGYTITPSQSGKTFTPASRTATIGTSSVANLNFIGSG